jgi:hypothetical protein
MALQNLTAKSPRKENLTTKAQRGTFNRQAAKDARNAPGKENLTTKAQRTQRRHKEKHLTAKHTVLKSRD